VLTNADADRILLDTTNVLKTDDGAGDVACDITLSRIDGVTTFALGDVSIDSGGEFEAVLALPKYVKVVNAINFYSAMVPNMIGCARTGNLTIIVFKTGGYKNEQKRL